MWFTYALIVLFAVYSEGAENNTLQKLIFGGSFHKITDAPYFALYLHSNQPVCGASIINDRVLLTAAHCFSQKHRSSVVVGTDRIDQGLQYDVKYTIIHPKYSPVTFQYDIAAINIVGRLRFTDRVRAIRLAPRGLVLNHGDMLTTMGFGKTERSDSASDVLRYVNVPYVAEEQCRGKLKRVSDVMICAGGVEGDDSCNGDSGGPLVYNNMLVGIVSFGFGECGSPSPGGYARISALRDFIDVAVKQLSNRKIKL